MIYKKHLQQLRENGFAILKNVLTAKKCAEFKSLLEKTYSEYSSNYALDSEKNGLSDKSGEKVVYNLHNKNYSWFQLFEHEKVLPIVTELLQEGSYQNNEPIYLYNISARSPNIGSGEQQIHIDGGIPGLRVPLFVNVMWYFDNVNESNGPTLVVPKSHRKKSFCPNGYIPKNIKKLLVNKGDVVIFDGSLWHGGSKSINGKSRWAMILGYTRWFIKPSFDYAKNTPQEIWIKLTDTQKRLLGFDLLPPKDEFTRSRRRSLKPENPDVYSLPGVFHDNKR